MIKVDRLTDRFDVASPLLPLQSGSRTCLFCDLVIAPKEARNNISVSAMETLKKPGGMAEKWSKVKPVSSFAKIYDLVWDKIKDLDTQSEEYQRITWPALATCCRIFHNTKNLETNSGKEMK